MATQRDELAEKTKAKIIEMFGPESALAQAMEDGDFLEKLAQLVAWLYGEIMLSQPRPEPPIIPHSTWPQPLEHSWTDPWRKTTGGGKYTTTGEPGSFTQTLWSAMSKYK